MIQVVHEEAAACWERTPLGVQITPWAPARDIMAASSVLAEGFDLLWVPDQMLARNVYALLSAIAAQGPIGVASGVTFPLSRNPIDMASAMATIGELAPPDRPVAMGMGAGGSLVASLFSKRSATDLLREAVDLIRRLWRGDLVSLGDYPELGARLRWRAGATARLMFPLTRTIPIYVAVGGPKTLQLASDVADGLLCTSTFPALSYAALQSGNTASARQIQDIVARRRQEGRPLRLVYGLNCCISADRAAARAFARRQVALIVGNPALSDTLAGMGLDVESARAVRAALEAGEGVEAAGRRLTDELLDGFVVAGAPDECVPRLATVRDAARSAGFDEFYIGAPLGPHLDEAARLLVKAVVPELWPEQQNRRGNP